MPKHPTSPSPSKKIYYAGGSARIAANKIRKMAKHFKKHPNDKQTGDKL